MPVTQATTREAAACFVMADRLRTIAQQLEDQGKAAEKKATPLEPMLFVADGWAVDESGRGWYIIARHGGFLWLKPHADPNIRPSHGRTAPNKDEPYTERATDFHHFTGQKGC